MSQSDEASLVDDLNNLSVSDNAGHPLVTVDAKGFAKAIQDGTINNVIVMCGAGISVSAGIPDFRTPGTGLYDNLQEYNLPTPEAIFTLSYFRDDPKPFCTLAKGLYPGEYAPTPAHHFIKLLSDKKILVRCYTQNIDGLEFLAGVPKDKVIQAHGGFQDAHCIDCKKQFAPDMVKKAVMNDEVPKCPVCDGLVKPDIVFFGEGLPEIFHTSLKEDFPKADALIVMGTSLAVQPFASLIDMVPDTAPRLLINLEQAGVMTMDPQLLMFLAAIEQRKAQMSPAEAALLDAKVAHIRRAAKGGFKFNKADNKRDVFLKDYCDAGVRSLCKLVADEWIEQLEDLIAKSDQNFKKEREIESKTPTENENDSNYDASADSNL